MVSDMFRAFKSNLSCSSHDLLGLSLLLPLPPIDSQLSSAEQRSVSYGRAQTISISLAEMGTTSSTFLKTLFVILSIIVRPHDQRNILISAASNLLSSDFFIANIQIHITLLV
ncbi:hypothetical protein OROGR_025196 [Orobanche gracilis]